MEQGYYGILEILSERDEQTLKLPGLIESGRVDVMVDPSVIRRA